jgi:hypothetical protein
VEARGAAPPEEEAATDEVAIDSAGRVSRAGTSAVTEAMDGLSIEGLTRDAGTTGSCGPGEAARTSADAEGSAGLPHQDRKE